MYVKKCTFICRFRVRPSKISLIFIEKKSNKVVHLEKTTTRVILKAINSKNLYVKYRENKVK